MADQQDVQAATLVDEPAVTGPGRLRIAVAGLVLAGLFSITFGWICDLTFGHDVWTAYVLDNFGLVIGLPMAAALAFAVIVAFHCTVEGPLSLKMGPLQITGPAGPILLWVVCFLAVVFAIRWVG